MQLEQAKYLWSSYNYPKRGNRVYFTTRTLQKAADKQRHRSTKCNAIVCVLMSACARACEIEYMYGDQMLKITDDVAIKKKLEFRM